MEEQNIVEEQQEEKYVLNVRKLKRRLIISSVSIVLASLTLLIRKYHDFDVIFKALYNMKYDNYVLSHNLGSMGFIVGFVLAILFTIFLWIYLYSKGNWQEKVSAKWVYDVFDIVSIIPVFVALVTIMNTFVISPATVQRTSMEPNYYEGDNVFILHTNNYERFDVVIVLAKEGVYNQYTGKYTKNDYYIKRVIGLPGETVEITGGEIYINGELLDDPTILKTGAATYCDVPSNTPTTSCTFVIPEGEYFLIGDNREASYDSRALGPFKKEDLYGVVILKLG